MNTIYRSETLRLVAWGDYGCFTQSEFRSDPLTYPIIPPTAAEGLVRSIFWHPGSDIHGGEPSELGVEVSEIWVMNPIRTSRFRMNELGSLPNRDQPCLISSVKGPNVVEPRQTSVTVVADPKYMVIFQYVSRTSAHVVKKSAEIFNRRLSKGQGFSTPCLGRRRYPAFVRHAETGDQPLDINLDLGRFPWRIEYDGPGRSSTKHLRTFEGRVRRGILVVPSYLDAMQTLGKEAAL